MRNRGRIFERFWCSARCSRVHVWVCSSSIEPPCWFPLSDCMLFLIDCSTKTRRGIGNPVTTIHKCAKTEQQSTTRSVPPPSLCAHLLHFYSFARENPQILFGAWCERTRQTQKARSQAVFRLNKAVRLHTVSAILWAPEVVELVSDRQTNATFQAQ